MDEAPEFVVDGPDLDDLEGQERRLVRLEYEYPIQVKLVTVLGQKLNLSRRRVTDLVAGGGIRGVTPKELRRPAHRDYQIELFVDAIRVELDDQLALKA